MGIGEVPYANKETIEFVNNLYKPVITLLFVAGDDRYYLEKNHLQVWIDLLN